MTLPLAAWARAWRSIVPAVLVTSTAMVAACGGGGDDPPVGDPPDATVPTPDGDPGGERTRTLRIGPVHAGPGDEQTICVVLDLGNTTPAMLRAIHTELTAGTHHVMVTRSTAPLTPEPVPCGPFAGGGPGADLLFIAQQSEARLAYPAGAGLALDANQRIHLEMHYFNPGDDPLDISGTVHLELTDPAAGLRPVQVMFTGGGDIFVPAHGADDVTGFYSLPVCNELFATAAHTHQWGRRATVALATAVDDPAAIVLHDSSDWAERPIDVFTPVTIAPGQGLRLTCEFFNESDTDVFFGLDAEDEMCFLWAHHVAPPTPP